MKIVPINLKQAQEFVNEHHRHNVSPQGHKFSIGLESDGQLVGVAIAGRPVARRLDDGKTLEVTRVCVLENQPNANSMLYGAIWRAAKSMGYEKCITYTLQSESGSSLRAAGWELDKSLPPAADKGWDVPSRRRTKPERYPSEAKHRWQISKGSQ